MKILLLLALVSISSADLIQDVKNARNFTGKVVLITGSNSGIGEQTVKLFAGLGAQTVVTGRNATLVQKVAKEVQEISPTKLKPLEVVADFLNSGDIDRLVNETIKAFNRIDVLINNAGTGGSGPVVDPNFFKGLDNIFQIDVRAALQLIRLSVPYLAKTNGSIIQISSIIPLRPGKNRLSYDIAKSSLNIITEVLAAELGPQNIRVNTISPGSIDDHAYNASDPTVIERRQQTVKNTPLGRFGITDDVAKGAVFLASSEAQFITGTNLIIDGGLIYNWVSG